MSLRAMGDYLKDGAPSGDGLWPMPRLLGVAAITTALWGASVTLRAPLAATLLFLALACVCWIFVLRRWTMGRQD
ncbi:hypothetical protein [Psychromarinibacter sp. S121]|uniref:hypothetical protein n=1 Tax=Psychromarinibacter sp. S121 TaxID=3415127 RepID=UPI003C7A8AF3